MPWNQKRLKLSAVSVLLGVEHFAKVFTALGNGRSPIPNRTRDLTHQRSLLPRGAKCSKSTVFATLGHVPVLALQSAYVLTAAGHSSWSPPADVQIQGPPWPRRVMNDFLMLTETLGTPQFRKSDAKK